MKNFINNSFWKTILVFIIPYLIIMMIFKTMERGGFELSDLADVLIPGIFSGVIMAWLFKHSPSNQYKNLRLNLEPGESTIMEGGASYINGTAGEAGKLVLTPGRLVFRAQKYDTQFEQLSFDLNQIVNIRSVKSWLLLKNELQFQYPNTTTHRFAVDDPQQWVISIEMQKGHDVIGAEPG